jgi:methylglutaconyl-CoA hydratase
LISPAANRAIDEQMIQETSRRIAEIRATPEAQEGLSAFLEKRQPEWATPPAKPRKPAQKRGKRL